MKVCTVLGARPQFVKAAAVSAALKMQGKSKEVVIHTGQHYDAQMSDIFFSELKMAPPSYNLEIGSGSHGVQTGRMLIGIEEILMNERPDWVLVYGDTNSTLAGALAAAKLNIPIAHVEAGLRSFNRKMPEEINRIATDAISTHLFAPTHGAVKQLLQEGNEEAEITLSGDVMLDVFQNNQERARRESSFLYSNKLQWGGYFLATVHRAENTDNAGRLRNIFEALALVAQDHAVVCPLHPRTKACLEKVGLLDFLRSKITFIPPVGYLDMLALLDGAQAVITDSGGLQKEAFFSKRPCFTLRPETEWTELVDGGWNILIYPQSAQEIAQIISQPEAFTKHNIAPYGIGTASQKIAKKLVSDFS